ncbi:diguanylate cyclase [Stenotrophomonas sp. MMGLT7]|uniref:sensor domain-containing diguanylate cyclase n=1 Tax=Stenotrophomonas sp. MMGLT7 TaxID=2901227 RepID=UPI001E3D4366|nr:diguanylate cyclase [Stenotrophomonas sp. MMGLT7]MCD7098006.1 diguanylate cyclase [Stenotrophomonas sp. MMGLT7]
MARKYFLARHLGPLLASLIFLGIGFGVTAGADRFISDAEWVSHTHSVIARIDQVDATLRDIEAAQRGYMLAGRVSTLADYYAARERMPIVLKGLGEAVRDNPQQVARFKRLDRLLQMRQEQIAATLAVYERQGLAAVPGGIHKDARPTAEAVRALLAEMTETETELLRARDQSSHESAMLLKMLAMAGIPFGIGVIVMVYVMMLRENRRRQLAERKSLEGNRKLRQSVQELEGAAADLGELSRFASMLQSCTHTEEALQLTTHVMLRLLPGTGGTIYRVRASRDYAEALVHWGTHALPSEDMLPVGDCWALRRGQPYLARSRSGDAFCVHVHGPGPEGAASACIPLMAQGVQLGFIYVSAPDEAFMSRTHIIDTAAEQLSMGLSNLQLQERLRIQSIRDPVTGLFNRRYLEESLGRELARCQRRNLPLALMMLDLDHFKRFNDTHGHAGGDALLAGLGKLLQAMSRQEDIACRYGGEEFTLILPEAAPEAALARAEEIRKAVSELRVQHLGAELPAATVSIGVAGLLPHGNTPELLLQRADEALYAAKRNGRDQVMLAGR